MRLFLSVAFLSFASFFCPRYFPIFVALYLLVWYLVEYPEFLRITFYEDLARLLLAPYRFADHPSTLLARLRLETGYSRFVPLQRLIDSWFYIPAWIKQELGYLFLDRQELFCEFNLQGEYRAKLEDEYFNLLRGIFSHGTLKQFIQAVRMYEAAVYASGSNDFSKAAREHLSCNFDPSADDYWIEWIGMDYPNSIRVHVLSDLFEKLQAVEVSSHGKYWLRTTINGICTAEVTELLNSVDCVPNVGRN